MIFTTLRRVRSGVPILSAAVTVLLAIPAPATAAPPADDDDGLSVAALAWGQAEVDARAGDGEATLEWTIVDDDPEATRVTGEVSVRMANAQTREYIGEAYEIDYGSTGCCHDADLVEGTAQRSSYRATIPIPQYAAWPYVTWVVTRITASEDGAEPEVFTGDDLSDFDARLRARTLVDTVPPGFENIKFVEGPHVNPYLYVNGAAASKMYGLFVRDAQAGFWKGVLELVGPTGQTTRSAFALARDYDSATSYCVDTSPQPVGRIWCTVILELPADAAEGAWRVASLTLVDGAGNRSAFRNPQAPALIVTDNRPFHATGIAAEPAQVDNWRVDREITLGMAVTGAIGGVTDAQVMTDWLGGGCYPTDTTPTVRPDGTIGIPIMVQTQVNTCHITGLVLRDGAGQVAVYGSETNGPDLNLALTRRPDPTPPVISTAALEPSTVPVAQAPTAPVTVTVTTDIEGAPLELTFVSLYDTNGALVCGGTAAREPGPDGVLAMRVYIRNDIAPGTYTVGLELRDTLDRTSRYGGPTGLPMPGGPLTLTILG